MSPLVPPMRNRGRNRLRLLAIVSLVAVLATACFLEDTYQGAPTGPHIVLLGDSIVSNAGDDLHRVLDPSYEVKISGWVGGRFDQAISEGHKYATQSPVPSRVVIEYGTNDSTSTDSLATSEAKMDTVISQFPGACIVLVNVGTWFPDPGHRRSYILGLDAAMSLGAEGVVDRALARSQAAGDVAATRDQVKDALHLGPVLLADYVGALGADLATNFSTDRKSLIHPSPAGNVVFADLIKATLDQCPPEVDATVTTEPTDTTASTEATVGDPTTTVSAPDPPTSDTTTSAPDEVTTTTATDPPTTDTVAPDDTAPTTEDVPTTSDPPPDTLDP